MGQPLLDLEYVLRSRKEQLTLQEANILMTWRAQAMRDFTVGFADCSIITWLATGRLRNVFRVSLTLGAGAAFGAWNFGNSVRKSVERILSLEGSRMQHELANILLHRYHHDPRVLQYLLSKHFYAEAVYSDSSADKPMLRWRHRNFCGEPSGNSQSKSNSEESDSRKSNVKKSAAEPKQVNVNVADDSSQNPFDFVFDGPESSGNADNPSAASSSSRKYNRKERRARRRHRRHHQEDDSEV